MCDSGVDIIITPENSNSDFNVMLTMEQLCNCATRDDFNSINEPIVVSG